MTEDESGLLEELNRAVLRGDVEQLRASSQQIEGLVFDRGAFADDLFGALLRSVESAPYAKMADGLLLLKIFEYNLDLLSPTQKKDLASSLGSYVPRALDAVSAFLAIELIAEIWKDRRSADAIIAVKERAISDETLALVAHGFDWLAKRTSDGLVRQECVQELEALSRHSSPEVMAEAQSALTRLMRKG